MPVERALGVLLVLGGGYVTLAYAQPAAYRMWAHMDNSASNEYVQASFDAWVDIGTALILIIGGTLIERLANKRG